MSLTLKGGALKFDVGEEVFFSSDYKYQPGVIVGYGYWYVYDGSPYYLVVDKHGNTYEKRFVYRTNPNG